MGSKGEGNRQRIIDAADALFYQRGYNQTSFQDISDATDIPRGNFYYYFKTKDEILSAVITSRALGINGLLASCEKESDDPKQRLLLFSNMLDSAKHNLVQLGCPIGSLSTELAKDDPALQLKSQEIFVILRDWISQQFKQLGLNNADDLAMDLLAKLQGVSVIACAFGNINFVNRSHTEIKEWINTKTLN
jgi:AcrR family transcriptional regulator